MAEMTSREGDIYTTAMQDFHEKQLQRNLFAAQCEEIADLIWPEQQNTFYYQSWNWQGAKRTLRQVDASGMRALHKARSIANSMMTPSHMVWQQIEPEEPALSKDHEVRMWFEQLNCVLWKKRYSYISGFRNQNLAAIKSNLAFGCEYLFVDELDGRQWGESGIRYKAIPWGEMYIGENHQGIVDNFIRAFRLTARQIWQRWGEEKFPDALRGQLEAHSEMPLMILHWVRPRNDWDPDALNETSLPWQSHYISVDGMCVLQEGGYSSFPLAVSRYSQGPGETYGRSIAMMVLPSLKTLNAQKSTHLKAGHRAADPVLLTADSGLVDISLRPGALNPGGMTPDGKPLIGVLPTGNIQISEEMMKVEADIIDDMFFVSLFKLAEESREMSAREVMERLTERGVLLAPDLEHIGDRTDFQAIREIDILMKQQALPPMPPALREAGGSVKFVNTSPIALAMRAQADVGFMRTLESVHSVAQNSGDQSVYDMFAFKRALPAMARNQFVPESYMATDAEQKQAAQARAQQQEREMKIKEAAPQAAIVKAQAIAAKAQAGGNIGGTLSGTPEGGMPPVPGQ